METHFLTHLHGEAVEYSRHEDGVHLDLELSLVRVKTVVAIALKTKNH